MLRLSKAQSETVCVVVLGVACLTLWLPYLGAVALNPDESQYEATASYLVATGTSAFLPNGAPGTFGLYKLMTWIAGPYPSSAMRALVMLAAFAIALMLYRTVARVTNDACGLLSGLLFLHLTVRFEGLAVNREWFASLCTVGGTSLFLAVRGLEGRARGVALSVAGLVCGAALWFKLQVSFMVFVVPLTMAALALRGRTRGRFLHDLLPFAGGGVAAGILYLLPFLLQGTLGQFLEFMFSDVSVFTSGNEQAVRESAGSVATLYYERFYDGLAHRLSFVTAYAFAAAALVGWWKGRRRDDDWFGGATPVLFALYLALAAYSVQLGNRFFGHYYQLMLPAVAACIGLAAYALVRFARERGGWRVLAFALLAGVVAERLIELRRLPLWDGKWVWPQTAFALAALVVLLLVLAYWAQRPLHRMGAAAAAALVVQSALVVAAEQTAPPPRAIARAQRDFSAVGERVAELAREGDRLFVWGWAPEIYTFARVTAASHITFCQYVANDLQGVPDRPRLNDEWAELLMRELRESKPRFIVDASKRSWFETERSVYDLDNYPDFELNAWLARDYERKARVDDCVVWELRAP